MNAPRDGTITANGLTAEFRFVLAHDSTPNVSFIETATGKFWALESSLTYDPPRDLTPEAAAVVAKELP